MRIYHARPGVLLTEVCGEYMLVATKEAREYCPYVQHINGSAAVMWQRLEEGATLEDLKQALGARYRLPERDIGPDIAALLQTMKESGYLLPEDETKDNATGCDSE